MTLPKFIQHKLLNNYPQWAHCLFTENKQIPHEEQKEKRTKTETDIYAYDKSGQRIHRGRRQMVGYMIDVLKKYTLNQSPLNKDCILVLMLVFCWPC